MTTLRDHLPATAADDLPTATADDPPTATTDDLGTWSVQDQVLSGVDGAVRVGCDVVRVERVAALLARRPAARDLLFTAREQADAVHDGVATDSPEALRRLAARFAAKEAVTKLLSRPRLDWTDVEVRRGPDGAPSLWLRGEPCDVAVSLSHDGDVALATVACAVQRLPDVPSR